MKDKAKDLLEWVIRPTLGSGSVSNFLLAPAPSP